MTSSLPIIISRVIDSRSKKKKMEEAPLLGPLDTFENKPIKKTTHLTLLILVGINLLNYIDRYTVAGMATVFLISHFPPATIN